jgi:hypothetical protein
MDKELFLREVEKNPFDYYQPKAALPSPDSEETAPKEGSSKQEGSKEETPKQGGPKDGGPKDGGPKNGGLRNGGLSGEQETFFLPLFFVELIHRMKDMVGSIKTFTHLSRDKLASAEYKDYFFKMINQDIDEIDSVLNSLIQYIRINTPIVKSNTLHTVLEEALKKYQNQIETKKIRVIKKLEKDLPETIVHEEQLRYIINSILSYAIALTVPNGSIGFLTKSFDVQKEKESTKTMPLREGKYVEAVIMFSGCRKSAEQLEAVLGISGAQKEEGIDLTFILVKEIVRKNHGEMRLEVDEKKPKTLISIVFPVERRKIVQYPSLNK